MTKPDPPAKEPRFVSVPVYPETMALLKRICSKEFHYRPFARQLRLLIEAEAERLGIEVEDQELPQPPTALPPSEPGV